MSIKIENVDVCGFEASIRGMRNPMNSHDKSDSDWDLRSDKVEPEWFYRIGENDLTLMKTLSKAGSDHGKFLRMINVTLDITAPLYWWKEFDTYKVGTVANSCSTMHKIHAKEFTLEDFSHEHMGKDITVNGVSLNVSIDCLRNTIGVLNTYRQWYIETKDKRYWWQMIQLLPSSYNQKRTVQLNYQVLKQMYFARRNHKLDEWHTLCDWMEKLPYFKEVVIQDAE